MAIKLTTGNRIAETSSKGNQEKWREDGRWYKLDLFGYEGLAETVTSALLAKTNVEALGFRYVPYRMERLEAHHRVRNGCSSPDFLQTGEAILTLADLFRKGVGVDWQKTVSRLPNFQSKVQWMVEQTVRLTGLEHFGVYLTLLFEIDMLFGNEDRHLNNIAVLRRGERFGYCPLFDFGAGLLSNIRDYPMEIEPKALVRQLRARPLDTTFARQVRAAEAAYGVQLEWDFDRKDIDAVLAEPLSFYAERDKLLDYKVLSEKTAAATARYNELSAQIKAAEKRMTEIAVLRTHIINYAKTREVYVAYRKAGYSKKFRAEHEADILLHQTAKKAFDELGMKKLPTVKSLQAEYAELMAQKKAAYSGYRQARDEMKELLTVKANVDRIMGYEEEKQTEKDHSKER